MTQLPLPIRTWLDDPEGGQQLGAIAEIIRRHHPECSSLDHAWLPRRKGPNDWVDLVDCETCELTIRYEGAHLLKDRHGEATYCHCCYQARIKKMNPIGHLGPYENTVSKRTWWSNGVDGPWWKFLLFDGIRGGDENCNRSIGFRLPGGAWFVALNIPLRQRPHKHCENGS